MFVQMHMLQSMPPGNLNRDDTGQPKKCLFGGTTRGRISSQCLKRNIRLSPLFQEAFVGAVANRTKYLPRLVADALMSRIPAEEVEGVKTGIAGQFRKKLKSESDAEEDGDIGETSGADITPQLVFFPPPFAAKVADLVVDLKKRQPKAYAKLIGRKEKRSEDEDKEADKAIAKFKAEAFQAKESMSVDVGLFGRMTTSDLIVDVEAACQVAHAISTHESLIEGDYFTAMDDRQHEFIKLQTQSGGAAFLGSGDTVTFFNSAVYYKYLNVDTDALAKLLGAAGLVHARHAAAVLVQAAAFATPTGKQNSFAAHSVPELILVEVSKTKQPISYANAFLQAVQGQDLMRESAQALSNYCSSIAVAYAPPDIQRFLLTVGSAAGATFPLEATPVKTLRALADAVEKAAAPVGAV
ncbi:MAG: type I-E CRISPR-associated protein Cas7/Cse4/CasC [Planctomycetota bacterium]|nr:MAG: type I-E CRISPR-associated protein Cas7/Cse4/CasC [Planctomycetota bacterium]